MTSDLIWWCFCLPRKCLTGSHVFTTNIRWLTWRRAVLDTCELVINVNSSLCVTSATWLIAFNSYLFYCSFIVVLFFKLVTNAFDKKVCLWRPPSELFVSEFAVSVKVSSVLLLQLQLWVLFMYDQSVFSISLTSFSFNFMNFIWKL